MTLILLLSLSSLMAKTWTQCAKDVCSNMGISSSSPYDCWSKLENKYVGTNSGSKIVYPMCSVAKNIAKDELGYKEKTVGNCSAAIAKSMGIYLSKGSVGESMCKIAKKVKSTKSLR